MTQNIERTSYSSLSKLYIKDLDPKAIGVNFILKKRKKKKEKKSKIFSNIE